MFGCTYVFIIDCLSHVNSKFACFMTLTFSFARETQNIHNNVTSTSPGVMSSVYILEKTVIIRP